MPLTARISPQPEDFNQGANYILFVEGETSDDFDVQVLKILLKTNKIDHIVVKPLGHCGYLNSVAQALHRHHPTYYFIRDRDDCAEDLVESSWQKFPDPAQYNLLIWRKRELENYFLDLNYLTKSEYFKGEKSDLENFLLKEANQRLYYEVARLAVFSFCNNFKNDLQKIRNSILENKSNFDTQDKAICQLKSFSNLLKNEEAFQSLLKNEEALQRSFHNNQDLILDKFEEILMIFSGGTIPLEFGHGNWLNQIPGKEILNGMLNRPWFVVENTSGKKLQGKDKSLSITKSLLKSSEIEQPQDFQDLCKALSHETEHLKKVNNTS